MFGRAWPFLLGAGGGIALGAVAMALMAAPRGAPSTAPAAAVASALPAAAQAAAPGRGRSSAEEDAAFRALTARLRSPDAAHLQEAKVWSYGPADERAVCGTLVSPEITGGRARFVVRVLLPRGDAAAPSHRPPLAIVEEGPGLIRPAPEAARRYCRDAPSPGALAAAAGVPPGTLTAGASAPPLPATGGLAGTEQVSASVPAAAASAALGRVVATGPANMRITPGGVVQSVVPRGRALQVFDRAPGGWMLVGETEPQGWIHGSLLSQAPPP